MNEIVLASQSPRRKQLLEWAGIPFKVLVAGTDESFPASMSPEEAAIHVAREKAIAVKPSSGAKVILAADTMVVLEGRIIGKPTHRAHAIEILRDLSGKKHHVITGVVISTKEKEISFYESTLVAFYPISEQDIIFYVDHYKPFDKAGGYAIQEWIGVRSIESITGDFYNVMGLPVSRVVKALKELD